MKCLRYGHTKNLCRGKERCVNCGSEGNCGENRMNDSGCIKDPECIHCKGKHSSISRNCEEYTRQKKLREIMVLDNLSLFEANKKMPKINNTTTSDTCNTSRPDSFKPLSRPQLFPKLKEVQENIPGIVPIQHRAHHSRSERTLGGFSSTLKRRKSKDSPPPTPVDHDYLKTSQITPILSNPHKSTEL